MSSSDVSAVTNYFSTAAEGFNTTLGTTIASGATSVPLNSTSDLTNGAVFVGIIEPGQTAQQTFTGTVDVSGSQITNVKWVRGTNVGHAGGVTIVDYVSGAAHNMTTAGILKQHTQTGAHTGITNTGGLTTDTLVVSSGSTLPAGDIITADLADSAVTTAKVADTAVTAPKIDFTTFNWYAFKSGTTTTTTGGSFVFTPLNGGLTVTFPAISGSVYELTISSSYVTPSTQVQFNITAQIGGVTVVEAITTGASGVSNPVGTPMIGRWPWTAPSTGNFTITAGVLTGASSGTTRTDNYMVTVRRLT